MTSSLALGFAENLFHQACEDFKPMFDEVDSPSLIIRGGSRVSMVSEKNKGTYKCGYLRIVYSRFGRWVDFSPGKSRGDLVDDPHRPVWLPDTITLLWLGRIPDIPFLAIRTVRSCLTLRVHRRQAHRKE